MAGFVGNKYYNDPNLGRVAAGLSSLFAPPAARDIAAMNQDKRLQMLFESGADPSASSALIGVQGYGDTPTGFGANLRSLESRNAYTADTSAAAQRYGYDRSLEGIKYGHDRYVDEAMIGAIMAPLDQGQVRPGMSPEEAGAFGYDLGFSSAEGAPKPLTTDELTARERARLAAEDQAIADAIGMDGMATTNIVGPGGAPVRTFDSMAALAGAEPYINNGAEAAPETANYAAPGGLRGTAYFDRADNTFKDTQTGAPIPPGSQVFKAEAQGTAGDVVGPTTRNVSEGNEIAVTADYALERSAAFRKLLNDNPGIMGVPGKVRKLVQDIRLTVDDLAAAYGPEAPLTLEQVMQAANKVAEVSGASGDYDAALPKAQAYALEMAYLSAKMKDPSGEVNVREMQLQLNKFDGGIGGNFNVTSALDVLDEEIRARARAANKLRGAGGQTGAAPVDPIAQARDAIAKGADRNAVRQRLIDNGVTPPGDL